MKTLIGCAIGAIVIAGTGFTYEITRAFVTENVVDVRLVEVGGHEYVVGTSFTPSKTCPSENYMSTRDHNVNIASCKSYSMGGGSSICLMHHVGCKACNKDGLRK